jgi:type IV secretion system protein VirB9
MRRQTLITLTGVALLVAASASAQSTRTVNVTDHSIVPVNAKLRFTTLIVLPTAERILDFVCGDKDFWVVSGAQNLAYVKPAKAGATTNLNLVTASGHVYSFLLTEGAADPDLKLYIEPDKSMAQALNEPPRFYTAEEVDALKRDAKAEKKQAAAAEEAATKRADDAIRAFRATYPTTLQFPYILKGDRKPFNVVAIYHDDRFTYIKANASELPALYEVLDGKPNLVTFQVEHGVYVVPKILERGYLVIGDQTLRFEQTR